MCFKKQWPGSASALLNLVNSKSDPYESQPHKNHITSKLNSKPVEFKKVEFG